MAHREKRLEGNVAGPLFVDVTCINCDTCRQLAPASFAEAGEVSVVHRQPDGRADRLSAYRALLACPVGAIGHEQADRDELREARAAFPLAVDGPVFYLGFTSAKSFGGSSYFVTHPDGNWLIDSPRYLDQLVRFIEGRGGLRWIFLTHEDDVADAARYAGRFGATRIIHVADRDAQPDAEWVVEGTEPVAASPGFLLVPTPGHTEGSMGLLHADRYLFTGDHLWWDRDEGGLSMPRRYVWSEAALRRSTARLLEREFEWVLPGHGERVHLPDGRMREELRRVLARRGG